MRYPAAQVLDSPNFDTGRTAAVTHVVFHTTEGGLQGSLNTLSDRYRSTDEGGRVSAHYVVGPAGEIYSLVEDQDTAWHVRGRNADTIGIEIVGWADDPSSWNPQNIAALSALVSWLSTTYGLPLVYQATPEEPPTARGFVSHHALDPSRRSDPGPYFPWEEVKQGAERGPLGGLGAVALLVAFLALAWSLTR